MNNGLMTEEYKQKKDYKKIIIIVCIVILLILVIFGITFLIIKNNENKKREQEEITVNSELAGVKKFAIVDNYIVGLREDNTVFKIYNLLQGTGQFGDFTSYFYNDDKLYLLFSDNNIYELSLNSGNGIYELSKKYSIPEVECANKSKTTELVFVNKSIILNNSNCAVTRINNDKDDVLQVYNGNSVNIRYASNTNMLYVYADNKILKYDLKNGEITELFNNINSSKFELIDNILLYTNIVNQEVIYYGYNVKTGESKEIVKNVKDLIVYDKEFIYYDDTGIYKIKNDKISEIYKVHYNTLNNLQILNNDTIQIVDTDNTDVSKERIININLKDNSKTINEKYNFTNIVEYK